MTSNEVLKKKNSVLSLENKSSKIQRLQDRIKALESTKYALEERCAQEEALQAKVLDKCDKNRRKWGIEKAALVKANKEVLKMMVHINSQIINVKGQP